MSAPRDTEPDQRAEQVEAGGVRLRDGIPFCLMVFVAVRMLLSVVAVIGVGDHHPGSDAIGASGQGSEEPATRGWHNALDGTVRWDAVWYIAIARDGYDDAGRGAAFFPGYPLATSIVDRTSPLDATAGASVVSNLAFFGSMVVLYGLTRREYSDVLAKRTLVLLAVFPTAFFFLAPYSESLFLLSTLLTFWWARGDQWILAALSGLVATATRSIGVVLIPCLLIEALANRRYATPLALRVAASLAPAAAPLAYALWWFRRSGDLFQPFHAQAAWMRSLAFPLWTLADGLALGLRGIGDPRGIYWAADFAIAAVAIVPLCIKWRALAPSYLTYAGLSLLVPLTYPLPARPLLSMPRFVIVIFPAFWAIALVLDRTALRRVVIVVATAGFVVASLAFMNWGFLF